MPTVDSNYIAFVWAPIISIVWGCLFGECDDVDVLMYRYVSIVIACSDSIGYSIRANTTHSLQQQTRVPFVRFSLLLCHYLRLRRIDKNNVVWLRTEFTFHATKPISSSSSSASMPLSSPASSEMSKLKWKTLKCVRGIRLWVCFCGDKTFATHRRTTTLCRLRMCLAGDSGDIWNGRSQRRATREPHCC